MALYLIRGTISRINIFNREKHVIESGSEPVLNVSIIVDKEDQLNQMELGIDETETSVKKSAEENDIVESDEIRLDKSPEPTSEPQRSWVRRWLRWF
jgi:hypothetical protein